MKKIVLKYIPLIVAVLSFSQYGCNKVVDLKPVNEISDADFWKNTGPV